MGGFTLFHVSLMLSMTKARDINRKPHTVRRDIDMQAVLLCTVA